MAEGVPLTHYVYQVFGARREVVSERETGEALQSNGKKKDFGVSGVDRKCQVSKTGLQMVLHTLEQSLRRSNKKGIKQYGKMES